MLNISHYTILDKLHTGHNSVVYRGIRNYDQTPVILKTLGGPYPSAKDIARLKHEYHILSKLNVTGVPQVYTLEEQQSRPVLILADIKGIPLDRLAADQTPNLETWLDVAIQLADHLGAIHEGGIIHKDINPSNIILNSTIEQVQIIDFGIASRLARMTPPLQSIASLEGTLAYMAPEQTGRTNQVVDWRTDFYALGVTLYEILTGQRPFQSDDPMELVHCHLARQPTPPHKITPQIPLALSKVILKLMAKSVQSRYQSTLGLKYDLEVCKNILTDKPPLLDFEPGQRDFSRRFQLPNKLYGRSAEIEALLSAFERVSTAPAGQNGHQGRAELALITGYSGVGKSALVRETHQPITLKRGHFITGKFDSLPQHNTPYLALVQAFQEFATFLLTKDEQELADWRVRIQAAVGNIGGVLTNLVPDFELIIGPQPDLPQLEGRQAQNRFTYVLVNFIKAIAQPEHPLVIFIDDLHWADKPTLNLIETMMTDSSLKHVLLIGAYRDNEVSLSHPLVVSLKSITEQNALVQTIRVKNLSPSCVQAWIDDIFAVKDSTKLAELVYEKTQGNPFFVGQFLQSLHEEGLLWFELPQGDLQGGWQWDISQVRAKAMADNVVAFMIQKLQKLPRATQQIVSLAACIGNRFELGSLAIIAETVCENANRALLPAVLEGLLIPSQSHFEELDQTDANKPDYRFAHDRIQQAAYALIPDDDKQSVHLKIGRLLRQDNWAEALNGRLFTITNHLNIGLDLIEDPAERLVLVKLNIKAGSRAKNSAAYQPAYGYFQTALRLLPPEAWQSHYALTLSVYSETAEMARLCSDYEQMDEMFKTVLAQSQTVLDKVKVFETRIMALQAQNQPLESVKTALHILSLLGNIFPENPQPDNIGLELQETLGLLAGRQIEDLVDLPLMDQPVEQAAMRIISSVAASAYHAAPTLLPLLAFKQVKLSIKYGNDPHSAVAYVLLGLILCGVVGDIDSGYKFGRAGIELLERLEAEPLKASTYLIASNTVLHWKEPGRTILPRYLEAYQSGLNNGDFYFAAQAIDGYTFNKYFLGYPLNQVEQDMQTYDAAIEKLNETIPLNFHRIYWQAAQNLLGQAENPVHLSGPIYDEATMLPVHQESNDRTAMATLYLNKLMLAYLFQDYRQADHNAAQIEQVLDGVTALIHIPIYHMYVALTKLALYPEVRKAEQAQILERVSGCLEQLRNWAEHNPHNYHHRQILVEAEQARVLGQTAQAAELYDHATEVAKEKGFQNDEALTRELTGRFYLALNRTELAEFYLQRAWLGYRDWGATAKMKQLKKEYPQYLTDILDLTGPSLTTSTSLTTISGANLDINTIFKAAQTLSGEIKLHRLLEIFLKLMIENAGAEKGVLLRAESGQLFIQVQGELDKVHILPQPEPVELSDKVPLSIINYVARTKKPLVFDNVWQDPVYHIETYVQSNQPKSVLCMPVLSKGELTGMIYMENNLATGVFTPGRLEILTLLASQAAISIENAELYDTLEQKVAERTAELMTANEALKASNVELDAFAHTVAHDLKSPLSHIMLSMHLLHESDSSTPNKEVQSIVQMGLKTAHKMDNIIDELLLLARVRKGEVNLSDVDMGQVIDKAQHRLIHMIDEYQAEIIVPKEWPRAKGYAPWVEEIWVNYLSNAMKYGGQPPTIKLGAKVQPDKTVRFWIQDNGPGLTLAEQAEVFTPFTRLDHIRAKGHGLGLSIVQRIAEKLGGSAGVESTVGQGSKFFFTLPAT